MTYVSLHRQIDSIAKPAGFMPTLWQAIDSLSCNRTSEGYNIRRVLDRKAHV